MRDAPAPSVRLLTLWWLRPVWMFGLIALGTALWAASMSPAGYAMYDVPKYVDGEYLLLSLLAVMAFSVGSLAASRAAAQCPPLNFARWQGAILQAFYLAAGLCLFGYLVWLAVGVRNGFRPDMVWMFLNTPDSVVAHEFKENLFPTIPGVTTCTQFGLVVMILGPLPSLWRRRRVKQIVLAVLALGLFRAMFLSERLAIVELAVVGGLALVRGWILGRHWTPTAHVALRAAPILGAVAMLLFFGTSEYFRSWQFYQNRFDNIVDFTFWRMSAYYTLCHNNSALLMERQGQWPLPYSTLSAVWSFPLVERSPLSYNALTGMTMPDSYSSLYDRFGNREYNNEGGLLSPLVDGGYITLIAFWAAFGYLSERAYRGYRAGTVGGLVFFPLLFLNILETPRFLYLCNSRATPPLVFFAALLLYLHYRESRAASPGPSTSLAMEGNE